MKNISRRLNLVLVLSMVSISSATLFLFLRIRMDSLYLSRWQDTLVQLLLDITPILAAVTLAMAAAVRFYHLLDRNRGSVRLNIVSNSETTDNNDGTGYTPVDNSASSSDSGNRDILEFLLKELRKERERAASNANKNLSVGLFFGIVSIAIMAFLAFGYEVLTTEAVVVRAAVSLFGSAFSFFFLQLYRNGMKERQFYQNEITSLELKRLAHSAVADEDNATARDIILLHMALSDRNAELLRAHAFAKSKPTRVSNGAEQISASFSELLAKTLKRGD